MTYADASAYVIFCSRAYVDKETLGIQAHRLVVCSVAEPSAHVDKGASPLSSSSSVVLGSLQTPSRAGSSHDVAVSATSATVGTHRGIRTIITVCRSITLGAFFIHALDFKEALCSSALGMRHLLQPLGRWQEKRVFTSAPICCGRCLRVVKRCSRRLLVRAELPILFRA